MNGAPRAWLREGSIGSGSSGKSGQRFTHIVVLQGPESRELIGLGRAFPRPRKGFPGPRFPADARHSASLVCLKRAQTINGRCAADSFKTSLSLTITLLF